MPSRQVDPLCEWVLITFPDGHRMNATAFVGTDRFEEVIGRWRDVADTTVADEAHQRRLRAQERYDAAFVWWQGDTLGRRHPGALGEYMDP